MSSWNRGAKMYAKPKKVLPFYYDLTTSTSIADTFLNLLGAFIYSQKQNEVCNVYDPNQLVTQSLRYNPQIKLLIAVPEETPQLSNTSCVSLVSNLKLTDIQKSASNLFQYLPDFNRSILQVLEQASIKTTFDIGLHIVSGTNLQPYIDAIRDYQKKSKKATLAVYVMADSYNQVVQLQTLCDPSWKLTSLSKTPLKDGSAQAFRELAEVQIFAILPAVILNFNYAVDRFIFIMNRSPKGYDYLREVNGAPWSLTGPPAPSPVAPVPSPVAPSPAPVVAAAPVAVVAPSPVVAPTLVAAPTVAPTVISTSSKGVLTEVNATTVIPDRAQI